MDTYQGPPGHRSERTMARTCASIVATCAGARKPPSDLASCTIRADGHEKKDVRTTHEARVTAGVSLQRVRSGATSGGRHFNTAGDSWTTDCRRGVRPSEESAGAGVAFSQTRRVVMSVGECETPNNPLYTKWVKQTLVSKK